MSISYDPRARVWSVELEETGYRTDFPIDYDTARRTNYPTDLKTDYRTDRPTNLPTNLRFDYPTNLPTDLKTDFNTNNEYNLPGGGSVRLVKGDTYTYRYYAGSNKYGSIYRSATIDGVKATVAKALVARGYAPVRAVEFVLNSSNLADIRAVRDKNDENQKKNEDNARINEENKKKNEENTRLNTENFNTNIRNAEINLENEKTNNYWREINDKNSNTNRTNLEVNSKNLKLNEEAKKINEQNKSLNAENALLNRQNTGKNTLYDKTLGIVRSTKGGDYVSQRDSIDKKILIDAGIPESEANDIFNSVRAQFKAFYQVEKLIPWDTSLGATPPYGVFDPNYYKEKNPIVADAYKKAEEIDDIDITERYGEAGYYLQHYTSIGKPSGLRGNKEEDTIAANKYTEEQLTDKELQDIRDYQLGVDKETLTERILNIPGVSVEWTKARRGDPYWSALAKEKYLDPTKAEEFAVLFRLSERPEDKKLLEEAMTGREGGITQLEDILNEVIGAKAETDVEKFAALNQTILKETIDQMKKVRGEQEMLAFYRGFSGFAEVVDINKTLSDSILGDTGVGGILSFTSAGKAEESLIGALGNVTGMRNNVTYNWEKWFNNEIKNKYGIDYEIFEPLEEKKDIIKALTNPEVPEKIFDEASGTFNDVFLREAGFESTENLTTFLNAQGEEGSLILENIKKGSTEEVKGVLIPILSRIEADIKSLEEAKERGLAVSYTAGDAIKMMNIEAQFARDYIDEYLLPRFNTSRSMDEFIEYLDVRQEEQNPFQTQDTYSALKDLSNLYTKDYLDRIKLEEARTFDPDFYFDPTGDKGRLEQYAEQKKTVEEDWEKAKAGDEYWNIQAYRFGIDVSNKAAFARMHFEVKGQGKGFDAAEDITNAGKIEDFIDETIVPVLKKEAFKMDPVFGQFITPEEFAEELLEGLDPYKTPEEWKEILQRYGLESFEGTIEELKEYIVETLRTGSALDIREQIKYLNEKRQKPTQEILGVTYIERPEDFKDEMAKPTTELYAIFQKAGYAGTEDEFYDNFFPDLDRSEQVVLTKSGRDDPLEAYGLDLGDPFASLGTIESFFPEDSAEATKDKESSSDVYRSYFRLGEEDDSDAEYKSDAGKKFLGEFTSMFKGL